MHISLTTLLLLCSLTRDLRGAKGTFQNSVLSSSSEKSITEGGLMTAYQLVEEGKIWTGVSLGFMGVLFPFIPILLSGFMIITSFSYFCSWRQFFLPDEHLTESINFDTAPRKSIAPIRRKQWCMLDCFSGVCTHSTSSKFQLFKQRNRELKALSNDSKDYWHKLWLGQQFKSKQADFDRTLWSVGYLKQE